MSEDLAELGMEGFDRVVDKYYDHIHDGCRKGYHGAGTHLPQWKHRGQKTPPAKAHPKRAASEPRDESSKKPHVDARPRDYSDDDDQGYVSDYPRRRSRRDSPSRENEPTRGGAYAARRKPYVNELPRGDDHIHPPPPQGNSFGQQAYGAPAAQQPYGVPSNQQLHGPPGQPSYPAPLPREVSQGRRSSLPYTPQYAAAAAAVPGVTRQRSAQSPPGERRRRGNRDMRDSRDHSPRRRSKHGNKPKDHSLSASLAGAVAGGLIGHQAGKGDMLATAAGAIVGALGGGIAADRHVQTQYRREEQDKDRSRQHGR